MYASELELNEVEARLLSVHLVASNLEAQIEGTFSFQSVQSVDTVTRRIQEAGFFFVGRTNLHDVLNEYVIEPQPAAAQGAPDSDVPTNLDPLRMVPGLWRLTHKDGMASMELVAENATDPKAVIMAYITANKKIDAIKEHRKLYGSSLADARDAVENMTDNKPTYAELETALANAQDETEGRAVAIEIVSSPRPETDSEQLGDMLRELNDIVATIPDGARLPGSPLLLDCVRHLVKRYEEADKRITALETALANAKAEKLNLGNQLNQALISRDDAVEALQLCVNADLTGYWSAEEVAKRYLEGMNKPTGIQATPANAGNEGAGS